MPLFRSTTTAADRLPRVPHVDAAGEPETADGRQPDADAERPAAVRPALAAPADDLPDRRSRLPQRRKRRPWTPGGGRGGGGGSLLLLVLVVLAGAVAADLGASDELLDLDDLELDQMDGGAGQRTAHMNDDGTGDLMLNDGGAGGGGGGIGLGDGGVVGGLPSGAGGLGMGGAIKLEQRIAAVFNKVAYGSTTTKRSIPDNVFVPSLTTVATPPLTTYR